MLISPKFFVCPLIFDLDCTPSSRRFWSHRLFLDFRFLFIFVRFKVFITLKIFKKDPKISYYVIITLVPKVHLDHKGELMPQKNNCKFLA